MISKLNLTGKLKGYLFQKTKLWEELVVLTVKFKKPRSQKKKQEVIKKMVYCVKMSTLFIKFYYSYYSFSLVCICSVEFKLLSVIVCTIHCVQNAKPRPDK